MPYAKGGFADLTAHLIGRKLQERLGQTVVDNKADANGSIGVAGSTWAGLLAPARTPPAIIERVADEVSRIVRLDDVKSRLEGMVTIPAGSTPEQFATLIAAETAKWGKVIGPAKVKLD